MRFSLLALTVCCSLIGVAEAVDQNTKPILALIPAAGDRQPAPAVMNQLEAAWLQQPNVALVERRELERILTEHQVTAAALVDPKTRAQLGQFVPADVLVFVDGVPNLPKPATRVQVTETKSGIILTSQVVDNEALLRDSQMAVDLARAALAKRAVPTDKRHLLGYLDFRSEESGPMLDGLAGALGTLVISDLARAPHIVVLEREFLQHLQTERDLTRLEQDLRASVRLLVGGIHRAVDTNLLTVSISLRPLAGGEPLAISFTFPADDIATGRRLATQKISDLLHVKLPESPQAERTTEARIFTKQVKQWALWGDRARAGRAAEAAVALDPSYSNRLAVARALTLETSSITLWATNLPPGEAARPFQLLLDCYRIKRAAIAAGTDTNFFLPSHIIIWDRPIIPQPLRKELQEAQEAMSRELLRHYAEYYQQTGTSYWWAWAERLAMLNFYQPPQQGQLIHEAVQAFVQPPGRPEWTPEKRLTMLDAIPFHPWKSSRHDHWTPLVPNEATERLFQQLLEEFCKHADPYIRFWANRSLEKLGGVSFWEQRSVEEQENLYRFRAAYLKILVEELGPSHPYRGGPCPTGAAKCWNDSVLYSMANTYNYGPKPAPSIVQRELEFNRRLLQSVIGFDNAERVKALAAKGQVYLTWLEYIRWYGDPAEAATLAEQLLKIHATPELQKLTTDLQRQARQEPTPAPPPTPQPKAEVAANGPAWADYDLQEINLGQLAPSTSSESRSSLLLASDGNLLYRLRPFLSDDQVVHLELTTHWLPAGGLLDRMEIKTGLQRVGEAHWMQWMGAVHGMVYGGDTLYVATREGLLCITPSTKTWKMVTQKDGLPGTIVRALGWYAGKLYVGIGCDPYKCTTHEQAVFAVYDPKLKTFEMLASEKAVGPAESWNGVRAYIDDIVPDPAQRCLWLKDRERGIWKYTPDTRSFECVAPGGKWLMMTGSRYLGTHGSSGTAWSPDRTVSFFRPADRSFRNLPTRLKNKVLDSESYTAAFDGDDIIAGTRTQEGKASSEWPRWLFLVRTNQAPAILQQTPAGQAFPGALLVQETPAGIVAVAGNGDALLIRRKTRLAEYHLMELQSATGNERETQLLDAADSGNQERVQKLLAEGVSIDAVDRRGCGALHYAIRNKHTAVALWLLERGAVATNRSASGGTALHVATAKDEPRVVAALLTKTKQVDVLLNNGNSPLYYAAQDGSLESARLLIDAGADVNHTGTDEYKNPLLLTAVMGGHFEVFKLLVERGASLERGDRYGNTALIVAATYGQTNIVQYLLGRGMKNKAGTREGGTALQLAAWKKHLPVVKLLLEAGVAVDYETGDGHTALMMAAEAGAPEIVKLLIARGANVNALNEDRRSALRYATRKNHIEAMRLLIDAGADLQTDDGGSLLGYASSPEATALLRNALEKKAKKQ